MAAVNLPPLVQEPFRLGVGGAERRDVLAYAAEQVGAVARVVQRAAQPREVSAVVDELVAEEREVVLFEG